MKEEGYCFIPPSSFSIHKKEDSILFVAIIVTIIYPSLFRHLTEMAKCYKFNPLKKGGYAMYNKLYTVTVFDKLDLPSDINKEKYYDLMIKELKSFYHNRFGDIWTCGIFDDINEAIRVVEHNVTDIQEGCYKYALVEEYFLGLYPHLKSYRLYCWNGQKFELMKNSILDNVDFQGFTFIR